MRQYLYCINYFFKCLFRLCLKQLTRKCVKSCCLSLQMYYLLLLMEVLLVIFETFASVLMFCFVLLQFLFRCNFIKTITQLNDIFSYLAEPINIIQCFILLFRFANSFSYSFQIMLDIFTTFFLFFQFYNTNVYYVKIFIGLSSSLKSMVQHISVKNLIVQSFYFINCIVMRFMKNIFFT